MSIRRLLLIAVLVCSVAATPQRERLLDASRTNHEGLPAGWTLMVKSGTPRVKPFADGDRHALCLDARNSSFSINRSVDIDLRTASALRWTWRANVLPPRGDFRHASRDDQAAQLFVVFARRRLGPATAINYIWDSNAPEGATGDYYIPLVINVKTLVVASGMASAGGWMTLERQVGADYKRLFGAEPPHVVAIRFQANAQHTKARAEGCIAEIVLD